MHRRNIPGTRFCRGLALEFNGFHFPPERECILAVKFVFSARMRDEGFFSFFSLFFLAQCGGARGKVCWGWAKVFEKFCGFLCYMLVVNR